MTFGASDAPDYTFDASDSLTTLRLCRRDAPTRPGLIHLIGRYYDPSTGQFLTVDPDIDQTGQAYAYAGNDPIMNSDPAGLIFGIPDTPSLGTIATVAGIGALDAVEEATTDGAATPLLAEEDAALLGVDSASATGTAAESSELGDDAVVVRGGLNTAETLEKAAARDGGKISVRSENGLSEDELADGGKPLPHPKIGVTKAGAIREAGGTIFKDSVDGEPFHCTVTNISCGALSDLFKIIENPAKN